MDFTVFWSRIFDCSYIEHFNKNPTMKGLSIGLTHNPSERNLKGGEKDKFD